MVVETPGNVSERAVVSASPRRSYRFRPLRYLAMLVVVGLFVAVSGSSPTTASASTIAERTTAGVPPLTIDFDYYWASTWSYNPWSSDFPGFGGDLIDLPLAIQKGYDLTGFVPELATRWSVKGRTLTVHLRSGVKWQDGDRFTSKDVLDTILLDGTSGTSLWSEISDLAAPTPTTVTFTILPHISPVLVENSLFDDIIPYPSSVYGQFVTPGLKADEIKYYTMEDTNPAAASKLPAYKAMGSDFQKLAAFKPKTLIGNGPVKLVAMNSSTAKLVKSPSFFDASAVRVNKINFITNASTSVVYGSLLSGQADLFSSYEPANIVEESLKVPGVHVVLSPSFQFDMVFNSQHYPFTLAKVRQAIAYLTPRVKMVQFSYGKVDPDGKSNAIPDGLTPAVQDRWLTSKQIASFNRYQYDPAKATEILDSLHFHKSGKQWIMPNGKPFTPTIVVDSGTVDIEQQATVEGKALSDFGIHTTVSAVSPTVSTTDTQGGHFDISFVLANSPDPLTEIDAVLGSAENFTTLGTFKGEKGIGFGPTEKVPGLGTVDVPTTIDQESATIGPSTGLARYTWDWARLVNQQVPYLSYANKLYQATYSTKRYGDWPKANSLIWKIWGGVSLNAGIELLLQDGYMRPR